MPSETPPLRNPDLPSAQIGASAEPREGVVVRTPQLHEGEEFEAGTAATVDVGASERRSDRPPGEPDPLIDQVVGDRWRVLRLVGRGGMGVVYEAQNVAIGKRVALKFIEQAAASDSEVVTRFQREAEAASAVESAHIVEVFDSGTTRSGVPYLVMELLRGESLGARLRREGRMSHVEAVHVLGQALRGLGRAHEAGVIHRDLKPDNLFLVNRDDDPAFVKILDFGISKIARREGSAPAETLTRKGTVLGTPYYMSPEQAQGHKDVDERTDLYALGAILFECLAGAAPCAGLPSYEAVIVAICSRDAPDVRTRDPAVPAPLAAVVARALARNREDRFQSAQEFFEALRASLPGVLSARGPISRPSPVAEPPRSGEVIRPAHLTSLPAGAQAIAAAHSGPHLSPQGPEDAAGGAPPQTRTSWTARELSLPPRPSKPAPSGRVGARKLLLLGLSTGALAFVTTLLFLRAGASPQPQAGPDAAAPGAPVVTLHIETSPPGARVEADNKELPDGLLRGTAFSAHEVRVSAPGYAAVERQVILDGKPYVRVDLSAEAVPGAGGGAGSSTAAAHTPPPHVPSGPKKPPPPPAGSGPAGLRLKVDP